MTIRVCTIVMLALATASLSACGVFGGRDRDEYLASREHPPLQVPDDLDRPLIDETLSIPERGAGRDIRGASAPAASSTPAPGRTSLLADRLILADHPQSAWRRVGVALERMGGDVEILDRDQDGGRYRVEVSGTRPVQGMFRRLLRREERVREQFDLLLEPSAEGTLIRPSGGGALARGLLQELQRRLG